MNIIQTLEHEQLTDLVARRPVPRFEAGDTVKVNVKIVDGDNSRIQAYEGVVIARAGRGLQESFTVRKISYGEGVERVFPLHSPMIDSIKVVRRGAVRRAKLYYLRDRRGKSARIAERIDHKSQEGRQGRCGQACRQDRARKVSLRFSIRQTGPAAGLVLFARNTRASRPA